MVVARFGNAVCGFLYRRYMIISLLELLISAYQKFASSSGPDELKLIQLKHFYTQNINWKEKIYQIQQ